MFDFASTVLLLIALLCLLLIALLCTVFAVTFARKELAKMSDSLCDYIKNHDDFLTTLSFELRNPLFPILGALSLLRVAKTEADHQKALGIAERQANLLSQIIDNRLPVCPPDSVTADPRPAPKKILVVDDNVDAVECLRVLLQSQGHDVQVAYDGQEAIQTASEDFDVVLLDIGLPKVDGYRVAKSLRRQERLRKLAIVAVTGYGSPSDKHKAADAGFDAHMIKPVNFNVLKRFLDTL